MEFGVKPNEMEVLIMLRCMVMCVVLGLMSGVVLGDTYYVNGTSGDDGWDGTSQSYQGGTVGPKRTIQAGIDAANPTDTVIVADGTYTGDGNRDIEFDGKAVTLRSENGADNCIIDCQGSSSSYHRGFYIHEGEGLGSVIDGFTVTNGFADYGGGIEISGSGPTISNCILTGNTAVYHGGAIDGPLDYDWSAMIQCDVDAARVNYADLSGGAFYVVVAVDVMAELGYLEGSEGLAETTTGEVTVRVSSNRGMAELTFASGTTVATMAAAINVFTEITGVWSVDDGSGDLFSIDYGSEAFVQLEVISGAGNGIVDGYDAGVDTVATVNGELIACKGQTLFVRLPSVNMDLTLSPTGSASGSVVVSIYNSNDESDLGVLNNCIISSNSASGSAGGIAGNLGVITNCIISDNSAGDDGGGLCWNYGDITNCVIAYNGADNGGGVNISDADITNCIIWANTAASNPQLDNTSDPTYTCVQGGSAGIGNIDVDPLFADAANGDYHLLSEGWRWDAARGTWTWDDVTSRCIDAGNPGMSLGDELLAVPGDPANEWGENIRINMGAYGGTSQASMGPVGWNLLADMTNDGIVDIEDMAGQSQDWLGNASNLSGDLNRDGQVNLKDFALLASGWLEEAGWR